MGKKLIIKGADFSENGFTSENIVYLMQDMILSGYNYFILDGEANSNNADYKGGFIDISTYTGYGTLLIKKVPSKKFARIAFVTQLPTVHGDKILYATGYNNYITIMDDDIHEYSIPNNATYLYVMYYHSSPDIGGDIFPERLALKE